MDNKEIVNDLENEKGKRKINKKILIIILLCIFILVISVFSINKKNKHLGYQLSELVPSESVGLAKIKGTIKNISNKTCKSIRINVVFSSGTLKEDGFIIVDSPEVGETESFDVILYGASDINNIQDYDIKLKSIECYEEKKELKPRTFKRGDVLTETELEDYFEDIYTNHTRLVFGFSTSFNDLANYPYIKEVNYEDEDKIKITYKIYFNDTIIVINDTYNSKNSALEELTVYISNSTESIKNDIRLNISLGLTENSNEGLNIIDALTKSEYNQESSFLVSNKWEISSTSTTTDNLMYFIRKK